MAWAVLGEQPAAGALVAGAAQWFSSQPESVRMEPLPWLASHLAEAALAAPPEVLAGVAEEQVGRFGRHELLDRLRRSSPAGRAALLLHDACGYSVAAVAALCRRPVDEIAALVGSTPGTGTSAPPTPPQVPPEHAPPSPGSAAPPPGPPPSPQPEREDDRRGRRGWWRRRAAIGPLVAVGLIGGITALVTHDGGVRPTLAEEAPAADRLDDRIGCAKQPELPVGAASMLDMQQKGGTRTSRVLVPPDATTGAPMPTLVLLGDTGSTADATAAGAGLETLAATAGVVVLTPEPASDARVWNVSESAGRPDDVGFVSATLDELSTMVCLDPDRVSVVGLGTGAHMAGVLSCRRNDRLASTVMIEGAYLPPACSMPEPAPLFVLASAGDRVLPPSGGFGPAAPPPPGGTERGYRPSSVEEALGRWAQLSNCSEHPQTESDPSGVARTMYADCDDGVPVSATVANLGEHGWPAEATAQVLSFVRDQVRR